MKSPAQGANYVILLEDLVVKGAPGVQYDIYLAPKNRPAEKVLAGALTFFGADDEAQGHHHGGHDMPETKRIPVSHAVQQLMDKGYDPRQFTILIEATTGLTNESTTSTKLRYNTKSKIRIGKMRLVVED